MSVEPAPAPPDQEWRRLHPLSPLLRGGLVLIVIAGIVIANMRDRLVELFFVDRFPDMTGPDEGDLFAYLVEQQLIFWALLALLGVIAVIVLLSWLSWRFHSYRITDEAVESRSGVLFRQHRRAPLERIQSVNLQRSLLARIFGLTQVDVLTAGQGGKVALQYLGHRDAKDVRERILLRAAQSRGEVAVQDRAAGAAPLAASGASPGALPGAAPLAVDPAGRPYAEPSGELEQRLRDLTDFDIDPSARETGTMIKVPVGRLIASILLGTEMLILVIVILALVVSLLFGRWIAAGGIAFTLLPLGLVMLSLLISQFNKGFNFTLSRAADGVRIGAGLTSTTTETIPFGRIHAVEARQPLGWRPFGWWKLRITTAGHSLAQGGQNKLQNTVLPVGELGDVLRVFETLLHGDGVSSEQREVALSHALLGDGAGFLGAGPRAGWVLWLGRRRAGLRIEDAQGEQAMLVIRRGWVTRSLAVMPVVRAQSVQLRRPLVHRMLGLASLQAHTVLGPVNMFVRGIGLSDAREAFDRLAETVVRVQKAESQRRAPGGS